MTCPTGASLWLHETQAQLRPPNASRGTGRQERCQTFAKLQTLSHPMGEGWGEGKGVAHPADYAVTPLGRRL